MSNAKLSCHFCGKTNTEFDKRGREQITHNDSFYRCKNCGTVLCSSCDSDLNKGSKCEKCGTKRGMVRIHKASDCFITTATLKSIGNNNDNCYELNAFREFRDSYMISKYPELVEQYYLTAPEIVNKINTTEKNPNLVYANLWTEKIKPCLRLIENNKFEDAKILYSKTVLELNDKYIK